MPNHIFQIGGVYQRIQPGARPCRLPSGANVSGTRDILLETGRHEDFVWEHFRKEMGLES